MRVTRRKSDAYTGNLRASCAGGLEGNASLHLSRKPSQNGVFGKFFALIEFKVDVSDKLKREILRGTGAAHEEYGEPSAGVAGDSDRAQYGETGEFTESL